MKDARQKAQELYNNLRTVPPNNIRAGKIAEWNKIAEQDISAIEQALQEAAKVEWPSEDEIQDTYFRGETWQRSREFYRWLKSRLKNVGEYNYE
jgi:hypothetical protein